MSKLWRIAFVLVLLLAACRAEATLQLQINEDGSGSYTARVGFDEEFREGLTQVPGMDPEEMLSFFDFGLGGVQPTQEVVGDMTFSVLSGEFTDVAQLQQQLAGQSEDFFERFDVRVDEEGAIVDAKVVLGEEVGGFLRQASDLDEDFEIVAIVEITMPGRVTSTNADERGDSDNVLIWNLDLLSTEIEIQAESTFQESTFPWWIVFIAALAAVILAGWWWWNRMAKQSTQSQEAAVDEAFPTDPLE